ncbi:MAG: DUF58 domain-containing protein [Clostridium sp.]|nr:DUF58 domain-containing protein [Clostridium sp.]
MIKVKKRFLILIVVTLVFAILSGGNLPYSLFYCVLIIFILSLIYILLIKRSINLRLQISKRDIVSKEQNPVVLKIFNDSIFPISYIEIQSDIFVAGVERYRGDVISLGVASNKLIKKNISLNVRGIYEEGKTRCKFGDVFGIVTCEKVFKNRGMIKVYPRTYPISNVMISGANNDNYSGRCELKSNKFSEENQIVKNIREYRTGDSYRRINWKVTAKQGKLFVKEYDNSESPQIYLFLDFRKEPLLMDDSGEIEEEMVEFFLSLVKHMGTYNSMLKLTILGEKEKCYTIKNENDFQVLDEYLMNHFSDGKGKLEKYMNKYLYDIKKNSAVVLITCDVSKENIQYAIGLIGKGYKVTIFYINKGLGFKKENIVEAINAGVFCYNVEEIR